VGSFCAPEVEQEIQKKVMDAMTPVVGAARARDAFEAGMALGAGDLATFVRAVSKA
jgi:hypothetical protein